MLPDQRDLAIFYQVALCGQFTQAAEKLQVSKAYVSKAIKRLEQSLETKLLQRTTRQLVLTDAGEQLFATAQQMHLALEHGMEQLQQAKQIPQGTLKISVPPAFNDVFLTPIITKYMQLYPEVKVELMLESQVINVIEEGYDLAFRGVPLSDSSLIAKKIITTQMQLVATPEFLEQHGAPSTPEEVAKLPYLGYQVKPRPILWDLYKEQDKATIEMQPKLTSNLLSCLKTYLLDGMGVANLPDFMVTADVAGGKLERVLPEWQQHELQMHVIYPSRDYIPLKTKTFLDLVYAELPKLTQATNLSAKA